MKNNVKVVLALSSMLALAVAGGTTDFNERESSVLNGNNQTINEAFSQRNRIVPATTMPAVYESDGPLVELITEHQVASAAQQHGLSSRLQADWSSLNDYGNMIEGTIHSDIEKGAEYRIVDMVRGNGTGRTFLYAPNN